MQGLSVVVPVYQAEHTLRELQARLKATLEPILNDFEILLIDDGSLDDSWKMISEITQQDPRVRGIRLSRNFGQHNALLCGILAAKKELILTLDDDLQNPPEEIPKFLTKITEGYDLVYGQFDNSRHSWWRRVASRSVRLLLKIFSDSKIIFEASNFRLFRAHLMKEHSDFKESFVSIDIMLGRATHRYTTIPVTHDLRRTGKSNYNLKKLFIHTFNLLRGSKAIPPRLTRIFYRAVDRPLFLIQNTTDSRPYEHQRFA